MHRVEGRKKLALDAVNIGTLVFAFLVLIAVYVLNRSWRVRTG